MKLPFGLTVLYSTDKRTDMVRHQGNAWAGERSGINRKWNWVKKKEGIGGRRSDVETQSKQCNTKDGNKKKCPVVKESREKAKKTVQQAGQWCCISTIQCIPLDREGNKKLSTFFPFETGVMYMAIHCFIEQDKVCRWNVVTGSKERGTAERERAWQV